MQDNARVEPETALATKGIRPSEPVVLCAGIVVADLFVPPLERLPEAGEVVATDDFLVQPGGCAANTAICLRRLGVRALVVGCVGDDPFASLVVRGLEEHGVDTARIRRVRGLGTSKTVVVPVVGEDRRFVHTFGANAALAAADLDDEAIAAAAALYVGGYLMLPAMRQDELAERLRLARERRVTTVLDVAVPIGHQGPRLEDVRALLPHADVFVPNDDEARALTGERDPHRQAELLVEAGARTVVVKLGERGAVVRGPGGGFELPAPPVEVVEPSGAGDAFAAGLIAGLLEGWSLERAVAFASVVGGSACTELGCWEGVFDRAQAEAFLAEHPLRRRRRRVEP